MNHAFYMRRCIEIAEAGAGQVAPNPLVGAVLVHNDKIISEGYHEFFGGPHAEVNALKNVTDPLLLSQSTLYVNLEPCAHFGKTPPCANLIVSKGVSKVVIANSDPNPTVNGKGIELMRLAGVEVICGVLEKEGLELNRRFFKFHTTKRPYIILKWAQSADGFIAPIPNTKLPGDINWISGTSSRILVHKWRSEEQSILVGSGTVKADNPKLNVRGFKAKNPVRLVIDPDLELDASFHVFDESIPTIVFNYHKNQTKKNLELVKINKGKQFLTKILDELYAKNIQSVLVEGGAFTLNSFIEAGLWDEMRVFTGPSQLNKGVMAPQVSQEPMELLMVGNDQLKVYRSFNNIVN